MTNQPDPRDDPPGSGGQDQSSPSDLEALTLDALAEAGNIGAGAVANNLAGLLGKEVWVSLTHVEVSGGVEFLEHMADLGPQASAMLETSEGLAVMLMPTAALDLIISTWSRPLPEEGSGDLGVREEVLREIGNICLCGYLSAMAGLVGNVALPQPPLVAEGDPMAILTGPLASASIESNQVVVIRNHLALGQQEYELTFLALPGIAGQEAILKAFGIATK